MKVLTFSGIRLAAACVLMAVALPAHAQNAAFVAAVDRSPVGLGEQFTLSFTLSGSTLGGGKNLQLPDLNKFRVMSGPNQSTSMQIINGAVSSAATYNYVLQPKEIGKFTIGPASIEEGGTIHKTQPITLEVVKGSPKTNAPPAAADQTVQLGDNLFLRAVVDRSHVTQGEQINLVFKLYTRVSVVNYAVSKNPAMTGFWSEDAETAKNITLTAETVNGKSYRVGIIKRSALFPTQAGVLDIGAMEVQATVQTPYGRSNDPFESFFRDPFGRNATYNVSTEALKIRVDPLPLGAPPDFKGAVGQFAMSVTVDKKTTRTNEPVTLKVTLSGTGNVKLLEGPSLELPADFEQYSPKFSESINRQNTRITGSKTFEYLLIPRYPGLKVIKPVTMSYYDLAKKDYVRLRSPQIELNVEQGTATAPTTIAGFAREDVRMLSQDIRFIKLTNASFTRVGEHPYASPFFIVMILLPLAGLAGAFVYVRQRQVVMMDQAGYRYRKAIKVAQKGLKEAEYLLKEKAGKDGGPSSNQRLRFYAEISHAFAKYLSDKLNLPQADFSVESASAALRDRGADGGLVQAMSSVLEVCDMARFAPTSMELSTMQRIYDEARRVIVELERTLKTR
jgi:hypothetical protein